MEEVRPQGMLQRHTGVGYELVQAVRPLLGAQEAERALPAFLQRKKRGGGCGGGEVHRRGAGRSSEVDWVAAVVFLLKGKEEEKEEEEEEKSAEEALLFLPPTWPGAPGQHVRARGRVAGGHGVP